MTSSPTTTVAPQPRVRTNPHQALGNATHYLYFLVCAASEGPLAGLFKLGVTDRLPARHQEHTRQWEAFDLGCSALLRAGSRREAQGLEYALRQLFGDPRAESQARARGQQLTSEDLIAAGSHRRHPGRRGQGYTEFYALKCLPDMLALVEEWVARRRTRGLDLCLVRGIDPADCASTPVDGGKLPSAGCDRGLGLHARRRARRAQEERERQELAERRMGQILEFAWAHEERLFWVDLRHWHVPPSPGAPAGWGLVGRVGLYFTPFDLSALRTGTDAAGEQSSCAARARFEQGIAPLIVPVGPSPPGQWRLRPRPVCHFFDPVHLHPSLLPHPACAGTLLLRTEPFLEDPEHPLLAHYQTLARRVASRQRWEQPDLC